MPRIEVNLMCELTETQSPFFGRITREFFEDANRRHKKFPLIRQFTIGVAGFSMPESKDEYIRTIEAAGRRNYKKAIRNDFRFSTIDYNEYLDDIWEIRKSTTVRQGELSESFVSNRPKPINDPPPDSSTHSYTYVGILDKEGKLVAYAGCIQAGDLLMISHIYGHYDYQSYGVVPMLFVELTGYAIENWPLVKFLGYGSFFGASESLQRFKRKFLFLPHHVTWKLTSK